MQSWLIYCFFLVCFSLPRFYINQSEFFTNKALRNIMLGKNMGFFYEFTTVFYCIMNRRIILNGTWGRGKSTHHSKDCMTKLTTAKEGKLPLPGDWDASYGLESHLASRWQNIVAKSKSWIILQSFWTITLISVNRKLCFWRQSRYQSHFFLGSSFLGSHFTWQQ